MAPSRHDWKIVDWDVKPQHNQPTTSVRAVKAPASEPSLLAYLISTKITCADSFDFTSESVIKPYIKFDNPVAD